MTVTLSRTDFPAVSAMFPPCYVAAVVAPTEGTIDEEWPGQRLGLPRSGPGAVAGWGRRVVALIIDWILSSLVASLISGRSVGSPPQGADAWLPLLVYALEACVLTMTLGASAGQLVMRVVVQRLDGTRLDPIRAFIRTILICVVIPPLIFNRDQRGLHDLATDSITLRR